MPTITWSEVLEGIVRGDITGDIIMADNRPQVCIDWEWYTIVEGGDK